MTRTKLIITLVVLIALTVVSLVMVGAVDHAKNTHAGEAEAAHSADDGHGHGDEHEAHATAGLAAEIPGLRTLRVVYADTPRVLALTGEVRQNEDRVARVGSPVSGRLTSLRVRVGDQVTAGQTLAVVASRDVAEVRSALTRARAEEQAARARLDSLRALASTGALTEKPLEEARRDLESTQADVQQAQGTLERAQAARARATQELERVQRLAATKAFQAGPVEEAQKELAAAEAEVEATQAMVTVRQAAYDRAQRLSGLGLAATREVEEAQAEVEAARAAQKQATTRLAVVKQTLAREQTISQQDLHTVKEVREAQAALSEAEKDVAAATTELSRAKSHLSVAQAAYNREQKIAQRQLNARSQIREAEAAVTVARAEVTAAQNGLNAFHAAGGGSAGMASLAIAAPLSGVVTERPATPGQAVEASTELLTIATLDPVWVWATVPERDLAKVGKGQAVEVRVNGYPELVFRGRVTQVATALDPKSRTARARCTIANPDGALKPGMFAMVNIALSRSVRAAIVPREAVLDEAGKKIVFVACADCKEDVAAGKSVCGNFDKVEVKLGNYRGAEVELLEGPEPGAELVVAGQYQLKSALGSGKIQAACCPEDE